MTYQWPMLIYAMLGAALGGGLRFALMMIIQQAALPVYMATLLANLLGCFLLGIVLALFVNYISQEMQVVIIIGFLGGLTTFSSFVGDIMRLPALLHAGLYICASVMGGLFACWIGQIMAHSIITK